MNRPAVVNFSVSGAIATSPRGTQGFGFDPIFVPDGREATFGEVSQEEKCAVSHRGNAFRLFAGWYSRKAGRGTRKAARK